MFCLCAHLERGNQGQVGTFGAGEENLRCCSLWALTGNTNVSDFSSDGSRVRARLPLPPSPRGWWSTLPWVIEIFRVCGVGSRDFKTTQNTQKTAGFWKISHFRCAKFGVSTQVFWESFDLGWSDFHRGGGRSTSEPTEALRDEKYN